MNLENAIKVVLEGQKTIGLNEKDVKKLSISQPSTSSFSVDAGAIQGEVSGGQVPENHTINTSVIDNGSQFAQPQMPVYVQQEVSGGETVAPASVLPVESEPVKEEQSNIFDAPSSVSSFESNILQPEVVPEVVTGVTVPEYNVPGTTGDTVTSSNEVNTNMFDSDNLVYQPVLEGQDYSKGPEVSQIPVYQESVQEMAQPDFQAQSAIPLDTPQTFYERQSEQDAQGGFSNVSSEEVRSEIPNLNTDPVVIMLDEVMRTVNERSKVTDLLDNENQILRNKNSELMNENESLKQQILELNNKVLIAEAQRQAAEQTLVGARMAESGMVNNGPVRTYQPVQQAQNQFYQQAA